MLAEIKPGKPPGKHPKRAPECIKQQKAPPIHPQCPRHHAIQLAENVKETCKRNGECTVPSEDCLDLAQAFRSESDLLAVPQEHGAAKSFPDQISDVVADDTADPSEEQQQRKRHVAVFGHYRPKD